MAANDAAAEGSDGEGWRASLEVLFEKRGSRTHLARNRHEGPLVVQKPLYPEGEEICHVVVIHPPGGIAGGDQLRVGAALGRGCEALITTPGAAKYYRSAGCRALQKVQLELSEGAKLEWLPQETILFDRALARQDVTVDLADGAVFFGHEIVCLGRRASGEVFGEGHYSQRTAIRRNGKLLWRDGFDLASRSGVLDSPAGLCGKHVYATMTLADERASAVWLKALREGLEGGEGLNAATLLPGVLVVRHLGDSTEKARGLFLKAWEVLRPLSLSRPALVPRVWNT